jgi:serine/threonine protein kinase
MSYEIKIGAIIDERFRITELIKRTGMSTIFKAMDYATGQAVALKVPHMELESDPAYFSRFERESEIGTKLNHPGILEIIPIQEKSRPYIVMEYLEGETFDRFLARTHPLPWPDALQLDSRLCEILDYMHQRDVVHRDLKPGNIVLCNDGSLRIMSVGLSSGSREAWELT